MCQASGRARLCNGPSVCVRPGSGAVHSLQEPASHPADDEVAYQTQRSTHTQKRILRDQSQLLMYSVLFIILIEIDIQNTGLVKDIYI